MFKTKFIVVWADQVVSVFGSNLNGFTLGVWLYQPTGTASNFAFVAICTVLPQILLSPLAGVLIDRYNCRWMILADSGAATCTPFALQTASKAGTLCAYLLAGVLVDRFLELLLHSDGSLASSLGLWFGVGPGRWIAILFFVIGLVKAVSVIWIYATPGARRLDSDLSAKPELSHSHPN
jgi:hypothetical protein